jgi:hypothetical protein
MLRKNALRRVSVITAQAVLVVSVLMASVVALAVPECREHTVQLTLDGVAAAWLGAFCQLLMLVGHRPDPLTVGSTWQLSRSLVIHHVTYGLVGGYLLGLTLSVLHCLFGW